MRARAIQSPSSPAIERRELALLVRRTTFGHDGTIELRASELGWSRFVEEQLHPESIDDSELDRRLAWDFPGLEWSAKECLDVFDAPVTKLRAACLLRAVHSKRQLFERVVAFWNDHFSIDPSVGECRVLKGIEDRGAIRAHAFGRFRDLLDAVTKSGAMMEYLDNRRNRGRAPNENFARELLELHTLGVGAFGERDVKEVARCFSGWTIRARHEAEFGTLVFDSAEHDDESKIVLGRVIPAHGGVRDGEIVLDMLARHPATARRIAGKLCSHFFAEEASATIVESVACAFEESEGDLRAVLRAVLQRENFYEARRSRVGVERAPLEVTASVPRKFLRPFHFVVAILRATQASISNPAGLLGELSNLGDAPFDWPTPDGAPDRREWWESALVSRWRFVERYMTHAIPGVTFDDEALFADTLRGGNAQYSGTAMRDEAVRPTDSEPRDATAHPIGIPSRTDLVQRIDDRLSGNRLSATDRAALQGYAESLSIVDVDAVRRLSTLAACAPSFQEI